MVRFWEGLVLKCLFWTHGGSLGQDTPSGLTPPPLSAPPLAEQGSRKHSLRSEAAPPQRLAQQLLGSADSTALGVWTPRPRVRTRAVPLCLRKLTSAAQRELSELKGPGDSPWTEASPVPGLERGGDEAVCGELRHLEGGDDSVSAPQAPGLLLGPHRPVRSAVLTVPGASPGPSKAGVLEPVCKTTSLSEDAYKHGVSPLLAFYILGSTRSFDWKVETKRIQQLLKLSGDRADLVCHRRGH